MAEKATRLAYIMSRLGIRAEEVSKRTGIDKTLISRWKNGQRRMSATSAYSKRISAFLLSLDEAEAVIGKTLKAYGLDESNGSLLENFTLWLAEQEMPSPSWRNMLQEADSHEYTASFRVFLGYDGLRSAILTMIDYVMTLPGPQEVVAVVFSDYSWVTADPEFFDIFVKRLSLAFERGVTLTMVSRDDFISDQKPYFPALWLSAHLKGYIKSHYYQENNEDNEEKIFLAVKDGVCLRLEHDAEVVDGLYAAMYTDNVTVRNVYRSGMDFLSRASSQFQYGYFENPGRFLREAYSEKLLQQDCYVCSRVPSLGTVNHRQAHLYAKETLRASRERTEQVKALFITPPQFQAPALVRHIFCLEDIEELLSPGRTVDYPFSAIYNKRIHHSHKLVLKQLAQIREWLRDNPRYELAIAPRHAYAKTSLEFICLRANFCVAWKSSFAASTCVKDQSKVAALFDYADQLWDSLPKYCRDRSRCIRQINQWLEEYGYEAE